jgi:pimeloyl-ACP methyl ester carboxylesterase
VLRAYGDGKLFGEPYGSGPIRVVWLHGWARRGQDFASAATQLAERGIASVALDMPGFGSSPAPSLSGGAYLYSELLSPALTAMSDEPFVLVGHSFGGKVATVFAAEHPELIRALVLTGVPFVRTSPTRKSPTGFRLLRWLHHRRVISDQRMESARRKYGSLDYRRASGIMRDIFVTVVNESHESQLAQLTMPVVMVWGAEDHEVPVDVARRAGELLRGVHSLTLVPGIGHLLPTDAPQAMVDAVLMVAT